MKKINLLALALFFAVAASAQAISNFDTLTLAPDTAWYGSLTTTGFNDGNAFFETQYDTSGGYVSWGGFAYSDKTDTVTSGYYNQFSAITGTGFNNSSKYAVGYDEGYGNVKLRLTNTAAHRAVQGFYVTNTTYAYRAMLNGDQFSGPAFNADSADFLLLNITGWVNGSPLNDTVQYYLADFTHNDTTLNYIVNKWNWVNLLPLGNADSLVFYLTGSRNDSYGLETPAYFAMDNFVTSDLSARFDTLLYNKDTLLNVLDSIIDTAGGPFHVQFVRNLVSGASVVIDSANLIWYIPQDGIEGNDQLIYTICNASNQCDTGIIFIDLLSPTGIHNLTNLPVSVYPNPCTGSFAIYHPEGVQTINLYDLQGRLIQNMPCNPAEQVTNVTIQNLEAGAYIVKLISAAGAGVTKVIKQ